MVFINLKFRGVMAGRKPAEETVTRDEVVWCRFLWDNNITKKKIREILKWGWRKLDKIIEYYEFPERPASACRHQVKDAEGWVLYYGTFSIGEHVPPPIEEYYRMYDLQQFERARRLEFAKLMMLSDEFRRYGGEFLKLLGTSAEEIAATNDVSVLQKKWRFSEKPLKMLMNFLKNQAELFGPFDFDKHPAETDSKVYSSAKQTIDFSKHLDVQMKILAQLRHSRDLISKK
jgi:hypothetical protein